MSRLSYHSGEGLTDTELANRRCPMSILKEMIANHKIILIAIFSYSNKLSEIALTVLFPFLESEIKQKGRGKHDKDQRLQFNMATMCSGLTGLFSHYIFQATHEVGIMKKEQDHKCYAQPPS
jgi:hypothetical protein